MGKEFLAILDKHTPERQRKARSIRSPHIDHDLRSKMILRDKFKKQFNETRNKADWDKYIELKNDVNIENKRKERDYFANKIRENNEKVKETWKTLNEALGRNSNKPKINMLIINKKEASCPQEISTCLNNHFTYIAKKALAEISTEMKLITDISSVKDYVSSINLGRRIFKFRKISLCQISSCIKKMKNSKSGTIPVKFVKDIRNQISPSLAALFNNSLSLGIFPENLKIVCLCPIYKGEGTRSNSDNYCPISVLPVLARIFEKLIHEQLYAFTEPHLHSFQSGFKQKHSINTFLLETTNVIDF